MNQKHIWASNLAERLIREHGLCDWSFGWNNRKTLLGTCIPDAKRIELSRIFVEHNDEVIIRDTILHEIAHALVGIEHSHGPVWQAMALKLGANPIRCCPSVKIPARWEAFCTSCGRTHRKHRSPKPHTDYFCRCNPTNSPLRWLKNSSV